MAVSGCPVASRSDNSRTISIKKISWYNASNPTTPTTVERGKKRDGSTLFRWPWRKKKIERDAKPTETKNRTPAAQKRLIIIVIVIVKITKGTGKNGGAEGRTEHTPRRPANASRGFPDVSRNTKEVDTINGRDNQDETPPPIVYPSMALPFFLFGAILRASVRLFRSNAPLTALEPAWTAIIIDTTRREEGTKKSDHLSFFYLCNFILLHRASVLFLFSSSFRLDRRSLGAALITDTTRSFYSFLFLSCFVSSTKLCHYSLKLLSM